MHQPHSPLRPFASWYQGGWGTSCLCRRGLGPLVGFWSSSVPWALTGPHRGVLSCCVFGSCLLLWLYLSSIFWHGGSPGSVLWAWPVLGAPSPAVTTITVIYNWMPSSTGPSSHTGSTQQAACFLIVIWVPWLALKGRRYYLDLSPVSQVPLEKTGPDPHVSLPSLLPFATSHPVRPAPPVVLGRKKHKHHSAFTSPSPSGLLRNETVCPSVTVHQYLPLNVALKELKT